MKELITATLTRLSLETGSTRLHIRKWLMAEGHDPSRLDPAKWPEYLDIVRRHQEASSHVTAGKKHHSPSGLTWQEEVQKEQARKLKMDQDIRERQMADQWLTAEAHHQILRNYSSEIEAAPDKIRTELGLSVAQRDRVRAILDEARFNADAATKLAFAEGRKKAKETAA